MSGWAPEIDARVGVRMRLSALLGGFRQSDNRAGERVVRRALSGVRLAGATP